MVFDAADFVCTTFLSKMIVFLMFFLVQSVSPSTPLPPKLLSSFSWLYRYDRQQVWRSVISSECCCMHCVWSKPNNMGQQFVKRKHIGTFWCNIKHPENDFRIDWRCINKSVKKQSKTVKKRPIPESLKTNFRIYWCSINVCVTISRLG